MKQEPPKLTRGQRIGAFLLGVAFTLLIPIEALVMGILAYIVFKQNIDAFQDALWAFAVLGILALAVDRCTYRALLKQALIQRDEARAQGAQKQPQPASNES